MGTATHLAIYGAVKIHRAWCRHCKGFYLVIDGSISCCGEQVDLRAVTQIKRMCHPGEYKPPPLGLRRLILKAQDDRCFYCNRPFGLQLWDGGKKHILKVRWDRMVPSSYRHDNCTRDTVAACDICTRFKAGLMFPTVEDASVWLETKWQEQGYRFQPPEYLPSVPEAVPSRP